MVESPRESKSACKYERRRSFMGCCWESDQGECLRLFGRSLSSARCERFLGAVLSSRKRLDAFVDTEFNDYGCTHIHTRAIAFRPLRAFCSHELNDERRKAVIKGMRICISLDFIEKFLSIFLLYLKTRRVIEK